MRNYTSQNPIVRCGCPAKLVPTYVERNDRGIFHEYTTMKLVRVTKNNLLKNELSLSGIHHELELKSLALQGSGSSNILLSKLSFDCKIIDASGGERSEYISFDLRIPGTNKSTETVFTYDMLVELYGNKQNLYATLQYFYELGRSIVNPADAVHGVHPAYDAASSKHDQYIRHTEQLLVAYLALPQGAEMLSNRLRTEIRGKYSDAVSAKVYNMTLHMHSTKTCCAPCEFALIGLMNARGRINLGGVSLGFLNNFKQIATKANERLTFTLPEDSPFSMLVTVTAQDHDKDHQKQGRRSVVPLNLQDPIPCTAISVKGALVSRSIFTSKFNIGYDRNRWPLDTNLMDSTVGVSGSKSTKGTPGTVNKVASVRTSEMDLVLNLSTLF